MYFMLFATESLVLILGLLGYGAFFVRAELDNDTFYRRLAIGYCILAGWGLSGVLVVLYAGWILALGR